MTNKKKLSFRIIYFLTGASYALFIALIGVFLLFGVLKLKSRNLLLALYLPNILFGILPGLTSSRRHLIEFLAFMILGSLLCSTIGIVIIDWQYGWGGFTIIILHVFLATLELSIIAYVTHLIKLKKKFQKRVCVSIIT